MTPAQCRAARAWLDWPQQELAKRSNVGLSTIRQFENRIRNPIVNNLSAMRRAFEDEGIEFNEDPAGITYRGNPGAELPQNGSGEASA